MRLIGAWSRLCKLAVTGALAVVLPLGLASAATTQPPADLAAQPAGHAAVRAHAPAGDPARTASQPARSAAAGRRPAGDATPAARPAAADPGTAQESGLTSISLGAGIGEGVAVDPATDTAYVAVLPTSSTGTSVVAVVNLATQAITTTIPVGPAPASVAVDPVTNVIYVINEGADSISVISGATDTVTATITLTGLPSRALGGIAVNPATDTIYVGTRNGSDLAEVTVINGATNTVTATISDRNLIGTPLAVAVNPDTDTIYAAYFVPFGSPATVYVINGTTNSVTSVIDLAGTPEAMTVDPVTNMFYVAESGETVTAYNGATNAATQTVDILGTPRGLAVNPDTNTVYATPAFNVNNVTLLSGADITQTSMIPVAIPGSIAADPDTDTVVVVTGNSNLTIIALQPASITSPATATFTTGQSGSFTVETTGTPVPGLGVSGFLPEGLTWDNATITGTPAASAGGRYQFTLTADNLVGPAATQEFTLYVRQPPVIVSGASATFEHGVSGTFMVQATGFPAPDLAVIGTLPPGLTFTAAKNRTLTISGTPASSDAGHAYLLRLIASNGVGLTLNQHLTITVS